jgi:flagellar hook assembly protein FlgD
MTAIDTTASSTAAANTRQAAGPSDAFQAFTSQDFLKIMFAELTKQDPLQPNDSKALLEQIGQIRSIESDLQLTSKLEEMSKQNQVTVGGTLLGKFAEGKTSSGAEVRGYVDSISVTKDGIALNLSTGFTIPMDKLIRVIDPALVQPSTGTPPDDETPEPTDNNNNGPDDGVTAPPLPTPTTTEPKPGTDHTPSNNGGSGVRP